MSHDVRHATETETRPGLDRSQWFDQVRGFTGRYARELVRNWTVLFWAVAFPAGFYLLTITVFVDTSTIPAEILPQVKAATAVTYGMFGAIIASLTVFGPQLAADIERDRYLQYRSLPVAPSADLLGRLLSGLALSFVALAGVALVAVATGGTYTLRAASSLPVVLVAVATFSVVWMVVAIAVPPLVKDARYASLITMSIAMLAYFLTGYNGGDPTAFQGPDWLLNWLPNTLATRLVAHHVVVYPAEFSGEAAGPAVPGTVFGLGLLALYAAVSLLVGYLVMRRVFYQQEVLP